MLSITYVAINRILTQIKENATHNTYNGDGLRVGKSVNGELTRYLYEYDKVVLEENASGDQTGRNVYGINLLTRQAKDDTETPAYTLTYMYNGHADVTALLDTAGNVIATYYYDAFGNILAQTGTVNNNILYTGYQYDKETGLYYLNARMYDPVTARFMQEDTYTGEYNDPLSLNLYTYCKNEPLMYSDPTGHNFFSSVGNWFGDKVNKASTALSSAASAVYTAVTTTASSVASTAYSSFANTDFGKATISTVNKVANSNFVKAAIKQGIETSKTVTGICKSAASTAKKAAHDVSKFVYDNRVAIAIGAVAVASVAVGVVTFGAGGVAMAALGGALIGGGIGVGLKETTDLMDNGKIDATAGEYLGAYAVGAAIGGSMAAGGAIISGSAASGVGLSGASAASKLIGGTLIGAGASTGITAAFDVGNNRQFDSSGGEYASSYLSGAAFSATAEAVPTLFSVAKGVASKIGQLGTVGTNSAPKPIKMNLQLFAQKGGASTAEGGISSSKNLPALYDPDFASRQILNSTTNVTQGGRTITAHAAERMIQPPPGRLPTTMAEIDEFLDTATKIQKISNHSLGDTITLRNINNPIKEIVVDAATGKRVITVINQK